MLTTGTELAREGLERPAPDSDADDEHSQMSDEGRRDVGRAVAPWSLGLLCASLVIGGFSLGVHLPNLHNGLIAASFTAVGVFVVVKRPGNRQGGLFLATGLAHAVMFFGRQYGFSSTTTMPGGVSAGAEWLTWLGVWPLPLVLVLSGVTFMCFPDGRLPSPRWRPVVAVMVAVGALLAICSALWPLEYAENSLAVPHPLHVGRLRHGATAVERRRSCGVSADPARVGRLRRRSHAASRRR